MSLTGRLSEGDNRIDIVGTGSLHCMWEISGSREHQKVQYLPHAPVVEVITESDPSFCVGVWQKDFWAKGL